MTSKYSLEILESEAKKYSKRWEFQKNSSAEYQAAKSAKVLDIVCAHMNPTDVRWSEEELQTEALKYSSRGEFQKNSKAYRVAYNKGILNKICSHMTPKQRKFSEEQLEAEALKYSNRSDFFNNSKSAYSKAHREGKLENICSHMGKAGGISFMELNVLEEILRVYPKAQRFRDMKVNINGKLHIKGFELDIYVPELRKGIEFDGTYWHSVSGLKRSRAHWPEEDLENYHEIKDGHFKSKGISVYHVREEDWKQDPQICLVNIFKFLKAE